MWRKRRTKKKLFNVSRKNILVIFILFIILISFLQISRIELFKVKTLKIENNNIGCAGENQLKESSDLLGQNYFFLNTATVEKKLKTKFYCIKSVSLSKQIPDKVIVQISGRQPVAVLIDLKDKQASFSSLLENIATPSALLTGNSFIIDNEGMVFDKDKNDLSIPRIYIYNLDIALGKSLTDNLIINTLKILDKVKTFGTLVKESWIGNNFYIIAGDPKPKIIFRLDEQIDTQLASLQLILTEAKINSRELEFIDLRFDKPIVKFTPKK